MRIGFLEILGVIGLSIALFALVVNVQDVRVAPPPVRLLRAWAIAATFAAAIYYAGTLVGVFSVAEQGPYIFRPIAIALLAIVAAAPILRGWRSRR